MKFDIKFVVIALLLLPGFRSIAQETYMDSSFGANGIVTTGKFEPKTIALQQDGKILVAGNAENGIVRRFYPDGSPDAGFGSSGVVIVEAIPSVVGIKQLTDGQILVFGKGKTISMPFQSSYSQFVFVHLSSNGAIVQTTNISHWNNPNQAQDSPAMVKFLPDGKIVAVGGYTTYSIAIDQFTQGAIVARYNSDLTLDTTFNGTGYRKLQSARPFRCMAVYDDGSIVAGTMSSGNVRLYRFTADGQVDMSLSGAGTAILDYGSADDRIFNLDILQDDKLLLSGSVNSAYHKAVLTGVNANGSLDTSYGSNGIFTLENSSGHNEVAVQSIQLSNGRVLSGLQRWNTNTDNLDYGLLFTTADGAVDTSFGQLGQFVVEMDNNQSLQCIVQQPDGKILAAGFDEENMVLMRYDVSELLANNSFSNVKISIYPNPASDKVVISGLQEGTIATIYNVSGEKVLDAVADNDIAIDISNLPQGTYFIKTSYGFKKLIKSK